MAVASQKSRKKQCRKFNFGNCSLEWHPTVRRKRRRVVFWKMGPPAADLGRSVPRGRVPGTTRGGSAFPVPVAAEGVEAQVAGLVRRVQGTERKGRGRGGGGEEVGWVPLWEVARVMGWEGSACRQVQTCQLTSHATWTHLCPWLLFSSGRDRRGCALFVSV